MSLLTLVFPWVLGSFVATPLIGLLLSKTLGGDDDFGAMVHPMDRHAGFGEPRLEGLKLAAQIVPIARYQRRVFDASSIDKQAANRTRP
jgi:hypothetical protein